MHPLVNNLDQLTESEIELKITDLQKRYFLTQNLELQNQISMVIDSYKIALEEKRIAFKKQQQENGDSDLDNLINIS
jgi:hypothetical protein